MPVFFKSSLKPSVMFLESLTLAVKGNISTISQATDSCQANAQEEFSNAGPQPPVGALAGWGAEGCRVHVLLALSLEATEAFSGVTAASKIKIQTRTEVGKQARAFEAEPFWEACVSHCR